MASRQRTRRLWRLTAGAALAVVFLGDLVSPGPWTPPLGAKPPLPLERILAELPVRNAGRWGKPGDPLSMIFLGDEGQLVGALSAAGWDRVPLRIPASFREGLKQLLAGKAITACPPMNLYRVEGRVQDLNWSKQIVFIEKRHHFRLWRTSWRDERGRPVWWGSGNFDLSVRWRDLSHRPDPDNDAERDLIAASLKESPWVESLRRTEPQARLAAEGLNDKGYPFHTDRRLLVVSLKTP